MAIGYSFAATHRWLPRYDFGDAAGTVFSVPEVEIFTDPLFNAEFYGTVYGAPTVSMTSVIVPLGTIGDEDYATTYRVPTMSMVNLLKPLGTIGDEDYATAYLVPAIQMLDVLLPLGTVGDEDYSTTYRIPTVSCAP